MNITVYRRMTQISFIVLIVLIPVFDILRYDTATRELIVFRHVWSLGLKQGFYADLTAAGSLHIALQFFLKAILPWLFILSVFPLLGYFTGRFFCGWLCPEGTLFELADFLTLKLSGRRSLFGKRSSDPSKNSDRRKANTFLYGTVALLSAVFIPLVGGIALTGYFVAPKTIWTQISDFHFTFGVKAGIIGVSLYMLITSVLVRHMLCRFVCAAGLMQMLFGWISPLSLRLKPDVARMAECTDCRACEKACFMGIIPRKNKRDVSCVNCGACIVACNKELGERKGLFHYNFGGKCFPSADNSKKFQQGKRFSEVPDSGR